MMETQTFTIRNKLGLHARAAALLVKDGQSFRGECERSKRTELR